MRNPKEDKEEMAHLKIILSLLEEKGMVDDAWNEDDVYEASNKRMGYRRYLIDKKMIGQVTNTTTETEGCLYVAMFCVLCLVCLYFLFVTVSSKIQYLPNTVSFKILYLTNTLSTRYSIFQSIASPKIQYHPRFSIFQKMFVP